MELLKEIFIYAYMCLLIIEILFISAFAVYKIYKKHKKTKKEKSELEIAMTEVESANKEVDYEKTINKLVSSIIPAGIKLAETCGVSGPGLKKLVCLSQVMTLCLQENINYQSFADFISNQVDEIITLTKQVNTRKGE